MPTESKPIALHTECPSFKLLSVKGDVRTREDFSSSKVLIVAFSCNHCPYVKAYEDRMNAFAKEYSSKGVGFVCINSNDVTKYPEDGYDKMIERARQKEFAFDYLFDDAQEVARAFDAACTPEFYVYDQSRKLRYHGRFDDHKDDPTQVKAHYLKDAVEDLLAGKSPRVEKTNAIGCGIKWK